MPYDFKQLDQKFAAAKEWLAKEFRNFRTGRANPAILDGVQVSAYGSLMPLKQLAQIGVEDARTIRVQPYDASTLKDIERAITAANLGVGTSSDGSLVRVTFPELTGERRTELVKMAKAKVEEARTTIRVARDEAWKEIQEKERDSKITEDDKFSLKDELQKKVDKANEDFESAFKAKEAEMGA
ncbi:MAG TPA: ribosome recycling factor [Candidatus Paceibacterota bacterium]|nr:ribosome recycling factor [Candidatus Paceibacterota bacterium]